ncbi:MAG: hypothetical protein QOK11_1080 [Pseudonocardiales bacterium]|jgi:uncharacterized protein (DUF1501 family)|nr:hypothetical protein [Pseudonocardiales bacterium]
MTSIPQATAAELAMRRGAERVQAQLCEQDEAWGTRGWTRRRFLTGMGLVGVAALGSQLVTTRVAYGVGADPTTQNTLITIFLRGAADGLRILAPNSAELGLDFLQTVRGPLVPGDAQLLSLAGAPGWAAHSALQPLVDGLWPSGELAFVPAVSADGVTRSHFDAQQLLEKGGATSYTTGWLDRVLQQLGPGSTFRALAESSSAPASFTGDQSKLVIDSLKDFTFPGWDEIRPASQKAVSALYRGMTGTLGEDVPSTVSALATAAKVRASAAVQNGAVYPSGNFAHALKDLAAVLRADVGLQVATVDVGGWDTHTNEAQDLDRLLAAAAKALAAFMTDLGPTRRSRVTIVVMTEFGRRVAMNDSGGADHGHGSLMWLLGGGIAGGAVHGNWSPLSSATLADGDVPGVNNAFDVLGELVQKRLGVGALSSVFPNHAVTPLGVAKPA